MALRSVDMVWPDPVPCRPENPVQGIRACESRRTGRLCQHLGVKYCGVDAGEMLDVMELLGLAEFSWLLEDDVDPDDLADVLSDLKQATKNVPFPLRSRYPQQSGLLGWFCGLLERAVEQGCGLTSRFAERLELKDRY